MTSRSSLTKGRLPACWALGCGKTTVLRIAAGVAGGHSGRVLLDGVEVAGPQILDRRSMAISG